MNVGIEQHSKLIYEADGTHGHPVWPAPVMLQVVITTAEQKTFLPAKADELGPNSFIFREQSKSSLNYLIFKPGISNMAQDGHNLGTGQNGHKIHYFS